ncbi:3'(2'),5'-bisphosphate nucleotidase CysQ [Gangjinia marincola]|uniref:3'(2'),5'-bisphosphate nucleotidase CysQ n=1 Tax=Gangjinia marincola TaxID=578463 RepID=A0ABN1MDQ7_9FLAO
MNNNIKIAIQASLKAGEIIMNIYERDFEVETKKDNSPLTEADQKANAAIMSFLEKTDYPIISEENKQIDYATRKQWDTCWIVDPLDGTKEFIKRNGEFTVNIALVKDGLPKLGVIYVPATKELYYADVDQEEAYRVKLLKHSTSLKDINEYRRSIRPERIEDVTSVKVVGSRSHMSQATLDYMEKLKERGKEVEVVSKGSSLKFCLVAQGDANIYPRFAPTMEWDTAAGQAICNALGIDVISQETQQPMLYNKENLLNPWFIVGNVQV